jgi:hypothetical protein
MDAYRIEDAWRTHFEPVLRAEGFKGSGRHFRRIADSLAQCVSLQGNRYGGSFAINLGIQPLAILGVMGRRPVNPGKIQEVDCEWRRRLSEGASDQWWDYDLSAASKDRAAAAAAEVFRAHGLAVFAAMSGPSSPLFVVDPHSFEHGLYSFSGFQSTKVRMAFALSQLRKASGDIRASRDFAKIALANLGSAGGLRKELSELAGE